MILGNGIMKICSKFTAEHPFRSFDFNEVALAWVFSCKFAEYFQNTSGRLLLQLSHRAPFKSFYLGIQHGYT